MLIRDYCDNDERGWLQCRVLSFLDTAYFDNVLQEKETYDYPSIELVAESEGRIVGLLDIEYEEKAGRVCSNDEILSGMIWHLAVHPDFQNQGIASSLLHEAKNRLEKLNIYRLEAWTRDDQWVNQWYEARNFRKIEAYYHVFMEGKEMENNLVANISKFRPVLCFAHYSGDHVTELKQKFTRVHECALYETTWREQV